MILAALVLAALSRRAEVFHDRLCENLPEVKAWIARAAPELARVRIRELSESANPISCSSALSIAQRFFDRANAVARSR
jgi:hypothetical protein